MGEGSLAVEELNVQALPWSVALMTCAKPNKLFGERQICIIVEAVRHMRKVNAQIRQLVAMRPDELMAQAKILGAPCELVKEIHKLGRLPVVNYAAGGVATPADAALMMLLGADGVFVGSGIFKSDSPERFAKAIVQATAQYEDANLLASVSKGLGAAMKGIEISTLAPAERLQNRGW